MTEHPPGNLFTVPRSTTVLKAQWPASPSSLLLPAGTPGIVLEVELGLFGSARGQTSLNAKEAEVLLQLAVRVSVHKPQALLR